MMLIVVGLVTLAAPAPARAFDPQLALALASAAGAITMITVYLIVSNSREKDRAASMNGIYTCREPESSGPMGCGGPSRPVPGASAIAEGPMGAESHTGGGGVPMSTEGPMASVGAMPTAADAALQSAASPMFADGRSATELRSGRSLVCPGGQAAGPMGCDGAMAPAAGHSTRGSSSSVPTSMSSPYLGQ
ncbi:MAG TPA: hypothetical protein VF578_16905 [Methylomirabilota bacterium]